jgi:hypothetical protein
VESDLLFLTAALLNARYRSWTAKFGFEDWSLVRDTERENDTHEQLELRIIG